MQSCLDQDSDLVIPIFFKIAPIYTDTRFQERAPGVETDLGCDIVSHVVRVTHHVILVTALYPQFVSYIANVGQVRRDTMRDVVEDCYRVIFGRYCRKALFQDRQPTHLGSIHIRIPVPLGEAETMGAGVLKIQGLVQQPIDLIEVERIQARIYVEMSGSSGVYQAQGTVRLDKATLSSHNPIVCLSQSV